MADLAVETLATVLPAQADDQLKSLIDGLFLYSSRGKPLCLPEMYLIGALWSGAEHSTGGLTDDFDSACRGHF